MGIIPQYSRMAQHTVYGATGVSFSLPPSEDFTDGTWNTNGRQLALSEIGVSEDDNKAYIRIGNNINQIYFGNSGATGANGTSGVSGSSGSSGVSGTSGSSGTSGVSGSAGTSGTRGSSGTSGVNGSSGSSGVSGTSGSSGTSGVNGQSTSLYKYKSKTTITTGNPLNTYIIWNNATQISSTQINISHMNDDNVDIDVLLSFLSVGQTVYIQDRNSSSNFQRWLINGTPTQVISSDNYWTVPVSLITSGGTGTTNFSNAQQLTLGIMQQSGSSGVSGSSGISGTSGVNGSSGTSGSSGISGTSGVNGSSGTSGVNGSSGTSGSSGISGTSGVNGSSGTSGSSGISGTSGVNGSSGTSGSSGTGFSAISTPNTNRILTANGTSSTTAIAQSNVTFDGSLLTILGSGTFSNSIYAGTYSNIPAEIQFASSDETTALTTGTGKTTFRMPYAMILTEVRGSMTTAQTSGATFSVNVKQSGTTIFSTKLTFDNTEKTTTTAAIPSVLSTTLLTDDAEITVDIDQVGDGTAKGLKILLKGRRL